MKIKSIARERLASQHLVGVAFERAEDVLKAFGAVQAQDFGAAKWALGLRLRQATDDTVEEAFASGAILRTHVLRPTWHLVTPDDIRWMLELTGPRVHRAIASSFKRYEIDAATFRQSDKAMFKALQGGKSLTRTELTEAIAREGIAVDDLRWVALYEHAELEGVICSGPRRGKQHTYMLLDERAPALRRLAREEALGELARRYFMTRGPATAHDLAWWSGLTVGDAREAVNLLGSELAAEMVEGQMYFRGTGGPPPARRSPRAHLLPNYDEYTVAYQNRSAVLARLGAAPAPAVVLGNTVMLDGQLVGTWARTFAGGQVKVELRWLTGLSAAERQAVQPALARYGKFLEMEVVQEVSQRRTLKPSTPTKADL